MMVAGDENRLNWHLKRTLILGVPMVFAQLLQTAIGVTDSMMVARLGELPLAQITLGVSFIFFFLIGSLGFSIAVSVVGAQALGRENEREMRRVVRMGLWQAILIFICALPILLNSRAIFEFFNQPEAAIDGAVRYVNIALWSLLPGLIGLVFRSYLIALERNTILLIIYMIAFLANILGNYVLIFGHFGFPALGLEGSAWATVATNIVAMLALIWAALREPLSRKIALMANGWRADWGMFWELIRLGVPTSLGLLSEVGMFQMATLMIGWLGVSELAAHGIALQIASTTFMIPLGLSIVASVRAGNAVGQNNREGLLLGARAVMILIIGSMCLTALAFIVFPEFLIGLFLDQNRDDSANIMILATGYLLAAAVFQIADGIQVGAVSLLRGLKDMSIPAILAFIGYWPIGVSLGYYLGFHRELGGQGVWLGLAIGLATVALFLSLRFWWKTRPERFAKLI